MSEITINKEEYNNLVEIKEEFNKTVKKLDYFIIENVTLKADKDCCDQQLQQLKVENEALKESKITLTEIISILSKRIDEYKNIIGEKL